MKWGPVPYSLGYQIIILHDYRPSKPFSHAQHAGICQPGEAQAGFHYKKFPGGGGGGGGGRRPFSASVSTRSLGESREMLPQEINFCI